MSQDRELPFGNKFNIERRIVDMVENGILIGEHLRDHEAPYAEDGRYDFRDSDMQRLLLPELITTMLSFGCELENVAIAIVVSKESDRGSLTVEFELRDVYGEKSTIGATLASRQDTLHATGTEHIRQDVSKYVTPEITSEEMSLLLASTAFTKDQITDNKGRFKQTDFQMLEQLSLLVPHLQTNSSQFALQRAYTYATPRNESLDVLITSWKHLNEDTDTTNDSSITISLSPDANPSFAISVDFTTGIDSSAKDEICFDFRDLNTPKEGAKNIDPSHPYALELMGAIRSTARNTPKGKDLLISDEDIARITNLNMSIPESEILENDVGVPSKISAQALRIMVYGDDSGPTNSY